VFGGLAGLEEEREGKYTYAECQILHHAPHTTHLLHRFFHAFATASQQVLDAPVGVDLHGAQVREALNQAGLLPELLVEGIAEVVGWVRGDEEHGLAVLGHLDGERAGGCGLSYATFAAHENPAEGFLVEEGLEGGGEVICVDGGRHGCGRVGW
jgi:hypothetical protein